MTGETTADLDGYFLQAMRDEVGVGIPIVCSLDRHATVTRQIVEISTALAAYLTHPHTDVVETGRRAGYLDKAQRRFRARLFKPTIGYVIDVSMQRVETSLRAKDVCHEQR